MIRGTIRTKTNKTQSNSTPKNRRDHCRYNFATDLKYKVVRNGAVLYAGRGRTSDMSAAGISLKLDRVLDEGTHLELSLAWPGIYHGTTRVRLLILAQVTRSDEPGTAARVLHHHFQTSDESVMRAPSARTAEQRAVA